MMLVLAFILALLPLSALAETHAPQQGILVIPNGQSGVNYWRDQGGTDAYTAAVIGQGLTQEFQRRHTSTPRYTPPPLTVPDFSYKHKSDDQAWRDSLTDFLIGR